MARESYMQIDQWKDCQPNKLLMAIKIPCGYPSEKKCPILLKVMARREKNWRIAITWSIIHKRGGGCILHMAVASFRFDDVYLVKGQFQSCFWWWGDAYYWNAISFGEEGRNSGCRMGWLGSVWSGVRVLMMETVRVLMEEDKFCLFCMFFCVSICYKKYQLKCYFQRDICEIIFSLMIRHRNKLHKAVFLS